MVPVEGSCSEDVQNDAGVKFACTSTSVRQKKDRVTKESTADQFGDSLKLRRGSVSNDELLFTARTSKDTVVRF